MQFSKVASVAILFFISFIGIAFASPVARDTNSDVQSILDTLSGNIAGPLASIKTIGAQDNSTHDDAAPYVSDITAFFTDAAVQLATVPVTGSSKRQSDDEIATTVAGLLTDVAQTLDSVADSALVTALLPGLDTALNAVLSGLETLLAGVLNLVATLLVDVAGLLRSLALGLTLGALGL